MEKECIIIRDDAPEYIIGQVMRAIEQGYTLEVMDSYYGNRCFAILSRPVPFWLTWSKIIFNRTIGKLRRRKKKVALTHDDGYEQLFECEWEARHEQKNAKKRGKI